MSYCHSSRFVSCLDWLTQSLISFYVPLGVVRHRYILTLLKDERTDVSGRRHSDPQYRLQLLSDILWKSCSQNMLYLQKWQWALHIIIDLQFYEVFFKSGSSKRPSYHFLISRSRVVIFVRNVLFFRTHWNCLHRSSVNWITAWFYRIL